MTWNLRNTSVIIDGYYLHSNPPDVKNPITLGSDYGISTGKKEPEGARAVFDMMLSGMKDDRGRFYPVCKDLGSCIEDYLAGNQGVTYYNVEEAIVACYRKCRAFDYPLNLALDNLDYYIGSNKHTSPESQPTISRPPPAPFLPSLSIDTLVEKLKEMPGYVALRDKSAMDANIRLAYFLGASMDYINCRESLRKIYRALGNLLARYVFQLVPEDDMSLVSELVDTYGPHPFRAVIPGTPRNGVKCGEE